MKSHYVVDGKNIVVHYSNGQKYPKMSYVDVDMKCSNCKQKIAYYTMALFLSEDYHLCYDCFKDEIKIKINVEKFLDEHWGE